MWDYVEDSPGCFGHLSHVDGADQTKAPGRYGVTP